MSYYYIHVLSHQWSYGVTCWEVFTCGRVPYTGVPVMTLLSELNSGHRLDRPSNITCSNEMYHYTVTTSLLAIICMSI